MSKRFIPLAVFGAALVLAVSVAVTAQQSVQVVGLGYDPCLDPSKVLSYAFDGSDAAHGSATSGNSEHVAVSGTTEIYLCGGSLQGGAAGDITIRFGSGTACATSPTNIDVISVVTAGDGKLVTAPGTVLRSSTSTPQALCTVRSASMTLRGALRYVQE